MCHLPSATAASGSPPKAIVPATFSEAGSIDVASLVPWLKVMTRLLEGSYRIASGTPLALIFPVAFKVLRSKTVTLLSLPLLVKPLPSSGTTVAIPWILYRRLQPTRR